MEDGFLLEHGGKLRMAAARYNIPLEEWLDLSTGINPNGWQGEMPPASTWLRLPEDEDGLHEAACNYYGTPALLPVAGSQAAIQTLPRLREPCRVAVLTPSYNEHAYAWQRAGHNVDLITAEQLSTSIDSHDVVVVVNPNNPTGVRFASETLLHWHEKLTSRGGWLLVDEAFMDATPNESLAQYSNRSGLILLRSLGKFFGLAGARVGFVLTEKMLLQQLHEALGPWSVNAPARWVATAALQDNEWQKKACLQHKQDSARLKIVLTDFALVPAGGCALFQWVRTEQAAKIHALLAQQGVLTRLFSEPSSLRFGLPGKESKWTKLTAALDSVCMADLI
ncbi:L-threonine 3-O-phosphate decarboxylase [hydrothermal vent metagenome]|uniref:threonine-phosphate decarboxylase n=1 Tax=hydrothermal vent metagenome TaxID=652676 RepID=A0A3B0ZR60_9ZZZZ